MGDAPLRLVIVGHNPSAHAWASGHFYSNPTNWMWRILRETGIAPPQLISGAVDDARMPGLVGVGFTDVGSGTPGTDSSQFTAAHFAAWRPAFFARLAAQTARACGAAGCNCGRCGAPALVAFSGKRQFAELFAAGGGGGGRRPQGGPKANPASPPAAADELASQGVGQQQQQRQREGEQAGEEGQAERLPTLQACKPARIDTGRQWVLPLGWPLPLSTEVWVMTSTSGAAPMTRQQRLAPWEALAQRLRGEAWPRRHVARCHGDSGE